MAWAIDPVHSQAMFAVKHMMVSTVKGSFDIISGTLNIDDQNPDQSWIEAQANAVSINTRDQGRDGHLKSADFFDVANYPLITFKSTKVVPAGGNMYNVTGDMTIRGVTKPVTLKVEYGGQNKNLYGQMIAGVNARGTINRKDFGLNWNKALEAGGWLVGDEIKLEIELEAILQESDAKKVVQKAEADALRVAQDVKLGVSKAEQNLKSAVSKK